MSKLLLKEAVILCGGLGTRLREVVSDRPKPMADFNGMPFLEFLVDSLIAQGIKKVHISTSYMSEFIIRETTTWDKSIEINIIEEKELLGTGGAIGHAFHFVDAEEILILNGDSYCQVNLTEMAASHYENNAQVTMLTTFVDNCSTFGTVEMDSNNAVSHFIEKQNINKKGLVNAGIYIVNKSSYKQFNQQVKYSLEYDVFPYMIGHSFYTYVVSSPLYDIGTPESYERACAELGRQNL